jgi:VWFA-related protein
MLLPLVLAFAAHAQQQPTIRVPVRLVTIPALVFSKDNRLLTDLRAANFRVLDNGLPQSVAVDENVAPFSVAVVVQTNQDVRDYLPFVAKSGSVIDDLLTGASGGTALVTYSDEVSTRKPFAAGDLSVALKTIHPNGRSARLFDAAARAVALLAAQPAPQTRVLLLIGQPADSGSETTLADLKQAIDRDHIAVFAITLPLVGKSFVSDTFSLQGVSKAERGGYRASTDLGNLVRVLNRGAAAAANADPFTTLTAATGGAQIRVRTQRQFEGALAATGFQLHSAYVLSYRPSSDKPGYHAVTVQVDVPGAKVYARPGYWREAN